MPRSPHALATRRLPLLVILSSLVALGSRTRIPAGEERLGPTVRAVARHAPPSGEPEIVRLEVAVGAAGADSPATGGPRLTVRDGEGRPRYALHEGTRDGVARFVVRSRSPFPLAAALPGRVETVTLSADGVAKDPALENAWKEAARRRFEALSRRGNVTAFSRFVLDRLSPEATGPSRTGLVRAQDRALRRRRATTMDLTSGAPAVEESLQIERLRGTGRKRGQVASVRLDTIQGVTVRSHPWEEMLDGRRPEPHPIERLLPLDQYALEARSLEVFLEIAEWLERKGSPLAAWWEPDAGGHGTFERLERQLCLETGRLARTLGKLVVRRVAVTGSDPYVREGTDVTLIFETSSPAAILAAIEAQRRAASQLQPGCRSDRRRHRDHELTGLVSPRRRVSSWSASVEGFVVVSNSRVGVERVLDARDGRTPSQADGLDRRFIRTLLPGGDQEDAFLFLSDPAIRALVGPRLKLRESRRLEASASLRAISHATAWRHLRGEAEAGSIEELIRDGDLPERLLYCPDGGTFRLADDGRTGVSSVHGTLEFLTPNCETPLEKVTPEEKEVYTRFRQSYQRYWTRFFDPIGVQISLGSTKRVETVILPLIEMTEYSFMKDLFGGESAQKGPALETAGGGALLLSLHLNHESQWFRQGEDLLHSFVSPHIGLKWIGDRISIFAGDAPEGVEFREANDLLEEAIEGVFEGNPGGLRIGVRNRLLLAAFLGAVQRLIQTSSPDILFEPMPEYGGVSVVRVRPKDAPDRPGPEALYYATIGDGLFVSLHHDSLKRIIDRRGESGEETKEAGSSARGPEGADGSPRDAGSGGSAQEGQEGADPKGGTAWIDGSHLALGVDFTRAPRWKALITMATRLEAARLCRMAAERRALADGLDLRTEALQISFLGSVPVCPLTGEPVAADGAACGSVGPDAKSPAPTPLDAIERVRTTMTFRDDGLRILLELDESGS